MSLQRPTVVVSALALLGLVLWLAYELHRSSQPSALTTALSVALIAMCLVSLVLVATALFSSLGLTDNSQALALPDGSIRAIIALILLAAFVAIPVFLYRTLSGGIESIPNLKKEDADRVAQSLTKGEYVATTASGQGDGATFTVLFRDSNPAREDFAKTFLTAVSTLVASVASFYFGAGIAKTAYTSTTASGQPVLNSLDPSTWTKSAALPASFTISGENLLRVKSITFTNGTANHQAVDVTSGNDRIRFSDIRNSADMKDGSYAVVAMTDDGKQARLANAFAVIEK